MTQREAILEHLQTFGHITSWEAFEEYGVTRLSSIIFNLRGEGFDIAGVPVTKKNRFGHSVTFSDYTLGGLK